MSDGGVDGGGDSMRRVVSWTSVLLIAACVVGALVFGLDAHRASEQASDVRRAARALDAVIAPLRARVRRLEAQMTADAETSRRDRAATARLTSLVAALRSAVDTFRDRLDTVTAAQDSRDGALQSAVALFNAGNGAAAIAQLRNDPTLQSEAVQALLVEERAALAAADQATQALRKALR